MFSTAVRIHLLTENGYIDIIYINRKSLGGLTNENFEDKQNLS